MKVLGMLAFGTAVVGANTHVGLRAEATCEAHWSWLQRVSAGSLSNHGVFFLQPKW